MMNPAEFANIARAEDGFWWYRGMRRIAFGLLDPLFRERPAARVLEGGCGTGHFAAALEQRYGARVFPLDLGWEGLEYARGLGAGRLTQGDLAALPFPGEAFEAVISLDVIVHFPRGQEHVPMAELARVLAPGGWLCIRVSALDVLRSRHSQFAHERQRFTRARLMRLAEASGIQVSRCTYANTLLLPAALAKFRVWEPLTRQAPASGVAPVAGWLNRALELPLALEAAWIRTGFNLPLGQSLILIGRKAPARGVSWSTP